MGEEPIVALTKREASAMLSHWRYTAPDFDHEAYFAARDKLQAFVEDGRVSVGEPSEEYRRAIGDVVEWLRSQGLQRTWIGTEAADSVEEKFGDFGEGGDGGR